MGERVKVLGSVALAVKHERIAAAERAEIIDLPIPLDGGTRSPGADRHAAHRIDM